MKKTCLQIGCLLLCLVVACKHSGNSNSNPSNAIEIDSAQFGEAWPFTIIHGTLSCTGYREVLFSVGSTSYALNGAAREHMQYRQEINEIWRPDPKYSGSRISVGPLIDRGLSLCPN